MARFIFLLLSILLVSACSSEDDNYSASVAAVNLAANDMDFIYHNEHGSESLTEYQGLAFAKSTGWNLLVQDSMDGTVYSFSMVDANTGETQIAKTNIDFSEHSDVLLYAYGKINGTGQQEATITGLALNSDNLSEQQFALYVVHAYPAELGELDVYVSNGLEQKKISGDGVAYGSVTSRSQFDLESRTISVVSSGQSPVDTPMVKETFEINTNTVNVVFIAPESEYSNRAKLFHFEVLSGV